MRCSFAIHAIASSAWHLAGAMRAIVWDVANYVWDAIVSMGATAGAILAILGSGWSTQAICGMF